jgi:competence protein ComEC
MGETQPVAAALYQPLVLILATGCAGILVDRLQGAVVSISFPLWWLLAVVSLSAWWILRKINRDVLAIGAVLIAVCAVGAAWHHARWNLFGADELGLVATEAPQPV